MKLYRAKANGNVIHMSDEAAAVLVPDVYEEIPESQSGEVAVPPGSPANPNESSTAAPPPKTRKRRAR